MLQEPSHTVVSRIWAETFTVLLFRRLLNNKRYLGQEEKGLVLISFFKGVWHQPKVSAPELMTMESMSFMGPQIGLTKTNTKMKDLTMPTS